MYKMIRFGHILIFLLLLLISCVNNPETSFHSNIIIDHPKLAELQIHIYDSTANTFIDSNARFQILSEGYVWSEGPIWVDELNALLFSDVPSNKIFRWSENEKAMPYLGYSGHSCELNTESGRGSNGLILDNKNNLIVCQHGDRRVARMDSDLQTPEPNFVTIADNYKGMKFNSPNDLVMDQSGNIYFTDPPYGMPGNKTGEIGFNGVFKITPNNKVIMLVDSLTWPNGIALSTDQKTLYINQSDPHNKVLYSYDISPDGSLKNGKTLFNFNNLPESYKGLPDGLKVHNSGNIFATGPGGVHIISPDGRHLALIRTLKATANCAFNSDYSYLYTTTTDLLIRVKLK